MKFIENLLIDIKNWLNNNNNNNNRQYYVYASNNYFLQGNKLPNDVNYDYLFNIMSDPINTNKQIHIRFFKNNAEKLLVIIDDNKLISIVFRIVDYIFIFGINSQSYLISSWKIVNPVNQKIYNKGTIKSRKDLFKIFEQENTSYYGIYNFNNILNEIPNLLILDDEFGNNIVVEDLSNNKNNIMIEI